MISTLEKKILTAFPLAQWNRRKVCLAISGGADSVALLCATAHIAEEAGCLGNLMVVTVDHQSRGQESDGDVAFVLDLSKRLNIESFVCRINLAELEQEEKRQGSWESAARTLRYKLLFKTAKEHGARFVATAHHRDDQLETLLFRLFRGTGLDGLRGVSSYRTVDESTTLVRPLLQSCKQEIVDYLNEIGQTYRTDSSNSSPEYARNRVRNELVPVLESIFPNRWQNALLRISQQANETEEYFNEELIKLDARIEETRKREEKYRKASLAVSESSPNVLNEEYDGVEIPLAPFQESSNEIVRRYFRRLWKRMDWSLGSMGAKEWNRLAQAVRKKKAANQFPDNIFVLFPDESTVRIERKPK